MSESVKKAPRLPQAGGLADRIAPWAMLAGAIAITVAFVLAFTTARLVPGAEIDGAALIGDQMVMNKLLLSQKIIFFHVPVAITSFVSLFFTAYYGVRFLMTKEQRFDTAARIATEMALVFIACTMVTGEMWQAYEWQTWWTWEPRLTTYFILMLLTIGYFILRTSIDDPERRATFASVFGIVAFVDVPICFMITRLIPSSIHPVITRSDSGFTPDMLAPFLIAMFGMMLVAFGLYRLRLRQTLLTERVAALKEALED